MNELAMFGIIKGSDSQRMYNKDRFWTSKAIDTLLNDNSIRE